MATDTGRGSRKGRSQEALATSDQNGGTEALDQAEQSEWRVFVAEKARHQRGTRAFGGSEAE
jgi:hypothetical protein